MRPINTVWLATSGPLLRLRHLDQVDVIFLDMSKLLKFFLERMFNYGNKKIRERNTRFLSWILQNRNDKRLGTRREHIVKAVKMKYKTEFFIIVSTEQQSTHSETKMLKSKLNSVLCFDVKNFLLLPLKFQKAMASSEMKINWKIFH